MNPEQLNDILNCSIHRLHKSVFEESKLINTAGVYTVLFQLLLHARDTLLDQGLSIKEIRELESTAKDRHRIQCDLVDKTIAEWR